MLSHITYLGQGWPLLVFRAGLHFTLIPFLHLILAIVYDSTRDTLLLYTVIYRDHRL